VAYRLYNIARGSTQLKVLARLRGQRYLLPCVALVMLFHRASCVSAQDVSVGETPQQTNERIRNLNSASKPASHEYTIGNGDLVSISVFDVPELTRDVRVSQAGTISIPLVPARLHMAGLTEIQAEQMIADVLQANGLVSHPEIGVTVKEHKSRPITIVGAVGHPMVYEADHSVTLLEVLAEAGGISPDAGDTIIVTRPRASNFVMVPVSNPEPGSPPAPGAALSADPLIESAAASADKDATPIANPPAFPLTAETAQSPSPPADSSKPQEQAASAGNIITINLNDLLETGDTRNNIPLQAGDIVTVPHAGIVYVLGAVTRPGGFVLSNDRTQLTTLKVLALAGGLTNIAKRDHAVIIRKDNQGKQTETEVDLKKVVNREAEDLQMRASDILYVPDSRTKQALLQALQLGVALGSAVAIYRLAYH
jgi:polysaccharide export outer membrane protein